ncbi:MAG: ComF family protein [Candidatus Margulisbacteria bacterium]|nr:ComF family protein [Candidatus Margulisiibacteriota bacterium]
MKLIDNILDLVFPRRCHVCGALTREAFCMDCFKQVKFLAPSAFVHSVAEYEGALKRAIWRFKFDRKKELADPLGYLLAKYANRHLSLKNMHMIVPVPLHEKRLRQRGYNQSELLCRQLTKYYNIPTVHRSLYRVRDTMPQFELNKRERFSNIRGAFAVNGKEPVKGKNILLVDDIYTTGMTVSECTSMLKRSGASSVHVLTLSRAADMV